MRLPRGQRLLKWPTLGRREAAGTSVFVCSTFLDLLYNELLIFFIYCSKVFFFFLNYPSCPVTRRNGCAFLRGFLKYLRLPYASSCGNRKAITVEWIPYYGRGSERRSLSFKAFQRVSVNRGGGGGERQSRGCSIKFGRRC